MGRTKKVGLTGRFGARYGRRTKKLFLEIEVEEKKKHVCPRCKAEKVSRLAAGIWECSHCNVKFAGAAYTPTAEIVVKETPVVESIEKFEDKVEKEAA